MDTGGLRGWLRADKLLLVLEAQPIEFVTFFNAMIRRPMDGTF